jgi:hypothetical protein
MGAEAVHASPFWPPPRWLALALGAVFLVVAMAQIPLGVEAHHHAKPGAVILLVPFAVVGVLIAYRQRSNSIGWLLIGLALICSFSLDAGIYSVLANTLGDDLPFPRLAAFLAPFWLPLFVLLPLPVGLFPDGRIPAGRWRFVFWAYGAAAAAFAVWWLVPDVRAFTVHRVAVDNIGQLTSLPSPNTTIQVAYAACVLAMVARQIVRYGRARGDERQQLKWLLAGGMIAVVCFAAASWVGVAPGGLVLGIIALPAGIGIGVLKYRLYEIDRLISRTISYALLTAIVAGVFLGIVVLMTRVLPFSSPVAVAASTLAAAALFNPLRRRTQHVIDRRFNRSHYDAQATVAAFGGKLRDALDLEAIRGELLRVVDQTIAPEHASVWIRPER